MLALQLEKSGFMMLIGHSRGLTSLGIVQAERQGPQWLYCTHAPGQTPLCRDLPLRDSQ